MPTTENLTRVVESVLGQLGPTEGPIAGSETECNLDHREIARKGIEEGLKVALRLLREQVRSEGTDPD